MLLSIPFMRHALKILLEFIHRYIHGLYSRFRYHPHLTQAFGHTPNSPLRKRILTLTYPFVLPFSLQSSQIPCHSFSCISNCHPLPHQLLFHLLIFSPRLQTSHRIPPLHSFIYFFHGHFYPFFSSVNLFFLPNRPRICSLILVLSPHTPLPSLSSPPLLSFILFSLFAPSLMRPFAFSHTLSLSLAVSTL